MRFFNTLLLTVMGIGAAPAAMASSAALDILDKQIAIYKDLYEVIQFLPAGKNRLRFSQFYSENEDGFHKFDFGKLSDAHFQMIHSHLLPQGLRQQLPKDLRSSLTSNLIYSFDQGKTYWWYKPGMFMRSLSYLAIEQFVKARKLRKIHLPKVYFIISEYTKEINPLEFPNWQAVKKKLTNGKYIDINVLLEHVQTPETESKLSLATVKELWDLYKFVRLDAGYGNLIIKDGEVWIIDFEDKGGSDTEILCKTVNRYPTEEGVTTWAQATLDRTKNNRAAARRARKKLKRLKN